MIVSELWVIKCQECFIGIFSSCKYSFCLILSQWVRGVAALLCGTVFYMLYKVVVTFDSVHKIL